jgi:PIN domain
MVRAATLSAKRSRMPCRGVVERPIAADVVGLARRIGPHVLRSLDAIHLATAILVDADALITYDERLAAAARDNDAQSWPAEPFAAGGFAFESGGSNPAVMRSRAGCVRTRRRCEQLEQHAPDGALGVDGLGSRELQGDTGGFECLDDGHEPDDGADEPDRCGTRARCRTRRCMRQRASWRPGRSRVAPDAWSTNASAAG